jgi:hypothetical protein
MGNTEVENINAFRRLVIALPAFRANRVAAQRYAVGLYDFASAQQL